MRSLQSVSRAILFPLLVLVLCASSVTYPVSATNTPSGLFSGMTATRTLSLEDYSATFASSPEDEVAETTNASSDVVVASTENIAIRAINPGYTTDAGKNTGELIELINLSGEEILLDGIKLVYKSKTAANTSVLYEFPTGARFVGESILLRYFSAPEVADGAQDLTYSTSLAMAGSLSLVAEPSVDLAANSIPNSSSGTILSQVCWTGEENCLPIFSTTVKSRSYTTILRDDETGEYLHVNNPELLYDPEYSGLYLPPNVSDLGSDPDQDPDLSSSIDVDYSSQSGGTNFDTPSTCIGLEFSEILTYYSDNPSEQFIEFYNNSGKSIDISKCSLRYKKKLYTLASPAALNFASSFISPGSYYVYHPEITLTKNPTSELLFEIIDTNSDVVDLLNLPHGQKKKTSYVLTGYEPDGLEVWQITYDITPGKPNIFQEFQTCPAGKTINVLTGNCVNIVALKSILNDCGAGKYRNPETGRCKSYSSKDSKQTPCQEGYERNPDTNRCRKIKNNSGADYPVVPITNTEDQTSFIALWAILVIAGLGLVYVIFQFRHEILYFFRHLIAKLKH